MWGRGQNVLGTSTHLVPSRTLSGRVVRCRCVFGEPGLNSPKQNPAYSSLSAHQPKIVDQDQWLIPGYRVKARRHLTRNSTGIDTLASVGYLYG